MFKAGSDRFVPKTWCVIKCGHFFWGGGYRAKVSGLVIPPGARTSPDDGLGLYAVHACSLIRAPSPGFRV
jgi:hypothetical protein